MAARWSVLGGALATAVAGPVCKTCRGPIFSWDTMPVFFHGSQRSTGPSGAFSDNAIKQLIRYPTVTIEKWQGDQANGSYITQEQAWVASAKALKAAKPDISVVVWLDSIRVYTTNKTTNPGAKKPCGTGHFGVSHFLETHPEYLLHNASGDLVHDPWSGCHLYDHNKKMVRDWWQEMCHNMTSTGVIDGCGADASWQSNPAKGQLSQSEVNSWSAGHRQMMIDTTASMGDGMLVGKEPFELGDHVNAILDEGCANSEANILGLQNMSATAKRLGRRLVYECHAKRCSPSDTCLHNAAAFLIGAGENHYFGKGGWNQPGDDFSSHWLPDLFGKPLGAPLADGVKDTKTGIWSRSFAHGVNVTFDTKTNTGTISFP